MSVPVRVTCINCSESVVLNEDDVIRFGREIEALANG